VDDTDAMTTLAADPAARAQQRAQRHMALELANQTRRERFALKRRIAAGELDAADIILDCPPQARPRTWPVCDLLAAQRRWGAGRVRGLLERAGIPEAKTVGDLTARQRHAIAHALGCETQR
jgi:hypothetical protein